MKFKVETEFQETEIGKIPKEWRIEKLGRVVRYVKGRKPNNLYDEKLSEKHLPYLTAEYMRGLDKPKWCNPDLEDNILRVSSDDIVMIWDGSYAGHVFTGFEGILASTMIKITPLIDLDKKFLYYYLVFSFEKFRATTVGTGIPHVNKRIFNEFPIPLPPIREQKRISEIFSLIDEIIKSTNESIVRLERLKKALMRELLTGGIRVNEENGKLVFHREIEFQETEIGKIPKEWKIIRLEEVASVITGPFGSQLKKSELVGSGIKVYTQENVLNRNFEIGDLYISGEKFEELKSFEVKPHDVLVTIRGTIGRAIMVPQDIKKGIIHTNLAIIRLRSDRILPEFVELVFNESEILIKQIQRKYLATTMPALYGKTLKQLKIMTLPINEQKGIIKVYELINNAIKLYRKEKERLDRLKRGLMDLLLTGRVRVLE